MIKSYFAVSIIVVFSLFIFSGCNTRIVFNQTNDFPCDPPPPQPVYDPQPTTPAPAPTPREPVRNSGYQRSGFSNDEHASQSETRVRATGYSRGGR
jgi:hypothetical protein